MIYAGTGHRSDKLGGYGFGPERKLEDFAIKILKELQPSKIISGMALGWDQALAKACTVLGIPFIAAIPFKNQSCRWPQPAQNRYTSLLKFASEVIDTDDHDPDRSIAGKMQIRNMWMVDHCDKVLALYNGTRGGTQNCLSYATQRRKPIINVWDEWEKEI